MAVTEVISTIGRRAWEDLDGDPTLLELVRPATPPIELTASVDVSGLLGDSVALATLGLQELHGARSGEGDLPAVRLAGDRIRTSAQSERHLTIDGERPSVWAPLSGFWRTSDGWVRTHGNYPHHAERLADLLGVEPDASKDIVAAAVETRVALDLEEQAAIVGAIVGAVRDASEWAEHPQSRAVAEQPLIASSHADGPTGSWIDRGAASLEGVRVLDLTRVLAGPVATRDLALAGAEVLRVDSPRLPEIGWQHLETGAGKRSTTLDLAAAHDRRLFGELLATADVVVTGYRPGSLDQFGLDPESLMARRPGLVVAAVSAWGTVGPWANRRGFDSIVQAVTGIAMRESPDGVTPGALPAQALDHSAGHFLAAGIARGLTRQRAEGGTWYVGVALARLAQALLDTYATPAATVPEGDPTLQTGTTAAGRISCAAPPLTLAQGPSGYPRLAGPWGTDAPGWR